MVPLLPSLREGRKQKTNTLSGVAFLSNLHANRQKAFFTFLTANSHFVVK